jgi:hypothetical protein
MVHLNLTRDDPEFKEAKKNVTVRETNSGPATNDRQRSGTPDPRPQSVYQCHVIGSWTTEKWPVFNPFFSAS